MEQHEDEYVKILFRFYSKVLDEWTVETMWAKVIEKKNGLYKIDNIPFYASIASDDIVYAEYDDDEQMLTYRVTIEPSGNSTIQVVIMDEHIETNNIRDIFNNFGCPSEKFGERYFVLEIPADKNYTPIKEKLTELKDTGVLEYAEPVLSHKHWY